MNREAGRIPSGFLWERKISIILFRIWKRLLRQCSEACKPKMEVVTAVSYTHLDVYQRQEQGYFAVVFPDLIHHSQVFSHGKNELYLFYASLELSGPFMTVLQKKCPENPVISREK